MRIAIPQAHTNVDYASKVAHSYAHAVELAGGVPVEIPLSLTNPEIMQVVVTCEGVLLPGSRADVHPEKYGQQRQPETHDPDPARDNVDELLLQDAYNMRKPILAICFGMQILNVWRTGTLKQHLATGVLHTGNSSLRHQVRVEPSSRLAEVVGLTVSPVSELTVNTSHHQSVDQPGDGLRVVAWSKEDNVVEAVESTSRDHFVLGVQWHPERLVDDSDPNVRDHSRALFHALIEAARLRHQHPRTPTLDFESLARFD
ncbi:MAG TPA: gamma-glutamyl-gamma-aminobutyrate hydrolase family protein [Terriglobales bacterium]|nr:gamma-glutamyl-gamma-aminobutyrate hydrolase family protein [Terriglobales bacterium]